MACRCWIFRCTKNHIFFFQTSWKDNLSKKKIALKYDHSCIIGKDDISFSRKYDLTPWTENERWSFSKNGNMIFSSDVLKRWSFQKGLAGIWSFLYYPERWYFFFPENMIFFLRRKMKDDLSREIHGNMTPPVRACRCYIRNTTPLCQKRIKNDLLSQKYTQGWLTNWTDILEKVPIILCSFMEIFIGGFIYCFPAKQTQAT